MFIADAHPRYIFKLRQERHGRLRSCVARNGWCVGYMTCRSAGAWIGQGAGGYKHAAPPERVIARPPGPGGFEAGN